MSSKNPYTYQHNFDITNITTDPFALGTLSVGLVAWVIFIGGCVASTETKFNFPRLSWWTIAYEFALIFLLFLFYCFDLVDSYRNFLTASFAVAFVYTTNSANNLVYSSGSALAAASTGVILISMINMIWLIYYGGDNDSPINRWIDGFSLNNKRINNMNNINRTKSTRLSALASNNGGGYDSLISHPITNSFSHRGSLNQENPFGQTSTTTLPNKYSDYDDQTHTNTQINSLSRANSQYSQKFSTSNTGNSNTNLSNFNNSNGTTNQIPSENSGYTDTNSFNTNNYSNNGDSNVSNNQGFDQDIYPYRARALYAYEANPDDVNEISFEKGEILMISDIQGRWWQAKRENGEIGICPSNYVELM